MRISDDSIAHGLAVCASYESVQDGSLAPIFRMFGRSRMRILESVTRWLGTPDYDSWGPQDPARGNQSGAAATTCLNWRRFRPTSYRRSCPKRLIAGWISLLSSRDKMRKSAMRPD